MMNRFFVLTSLVFLFFAGCSSSTLDRTTYALEYEVTGSAPSVNISAVIPDGTDVGPGGAVAPPWSHTEEGTVDFTSPTSISLSADGLLQPAEAESITVTITYTLQDFEDIQTMTVTNTHPTVPATKTATVVSAFPIQP
jgi:hypothetical protein